MWAAVPEVLQHALFGAKYWLPISLAAIRDIGLSRHFLRGRGDPPAVARVVPARIRSIARADRKLRRLQFWCSHVRSLADVILNSRSSPMLCDESIAAGRAPERLGSGALRSTSESVHVRAPIVLRSAVGNSEPGVTGLLMSSLGSLRT